MKQLLLLGLGLFFAFSLTQNLFHYAKNRQFYESSRISYEEELRKKQELETQIAASKDMYAFEKIVRDKLNFHLPNEQILVIPAPSPTPAPEPTIAIPPYQQWIGVFFK